MSKSEHSFKEDETLQCEEEEKVQMVILNKGFINTVNIDV